MALENKKIHLFIHIKSFVTHHSVLCIAALLAIITTIIVPPDKDYIGYFDFNFIWPRIPSPQSQIGGAIPNILLSLNKSFI